MQPVKISIQGSYWDSLIYAGKLYLFDLRGSIRTINWDAAISGWPVGPAQRLAMLAAFMRSDFLYGPDLRAFSRDPDVRDVVKAKFASLARRTLLLDSLALEEHEIAQQDNPFVFPHADAEMYGRNLFVASTRGIERATFSQGTKYPVSSKIHVQFDAPVFSIAASYGTIAAAAGDEGLFQIPAFLNYYAHSRSDPTPAIAIPCEDCHWTFQSIFATSTYGGGALLEYVKESNDDRVDAVERRFAGSIEASLIFGHGGFAWGVQDKICLASNGTIEVTKYRPWARELAGRLSPLGAVRAVRPSTLVVAASSAPFGFVVEYADCLVVYPSAGEPVVLDGEPVNWRVFPRSKHYENQLHVIYNDRLEILSFNHDYFVDQERKVSGIAVFSRRQGADLLYHLMDADADDES